MAFERDSAIYVADLDGKNARKVADGSIPEISPDGSKVAFNTDDPKSDSPVRHLAIVDIESGKVSVLSEMSINNCFGPVWSPDGKSLLFNVYLDGNWQIGFIHADGTGFRVAKKGEGHDRWYSMPTWAPDGKSFFCHDLDFIYRFDLGGNLQKKWDLHKLITTGDMNSNSRMDVSPDGKSMIMDVDMNEDHDRENWDGPPPSLWLLDLGTDQARRLTQKDFFAWDPSWITSDEFLFISQGPKEDRPSVYRGSVKDQKHPLILKDGRTPSASL